MKRPRYELAVDTKITHGGKQSGRVRFTGAGNPEPPGFGTFTQCIAPDDFRSQRIRCSGFLRTENVSGGAGIWMRVDGPEQGKSLSFDNMQERALNGTNDWKKVEVVLEAPKEGTMICFGALVSGKGTMWVDDLKFEKVGKDVPTTDKSKVDAPTASKPSNLDFEAGSQPNGFPQGWSGGGMGYQLALDSTIAHAGKQSGRLRYLGEQKPATQGFASLTQAVNPDDFRGQRVRIRGFIRSERIVEGWGGLWMRIDGPDPGKNLGFDNMSDRGLKGTSDWKSAEVVLDVPKEAMAIVFGAVLSGDGTVWIDDLTLEKVGNDIKTTGGSAPAGR